MSWVSPLVRRSRVGGAAEIDAKSRALTLRVKKVEALLTSGVWSEDVITDPDRAAQLDDETGGLLALLEACDPRKFSVRHPPSHYLGIGYFIIVSGLRFVQYYAIGSITVI